MSKSAASGVVLKYYDHAPSNKSNEGFILELVSPFEWATNTRTWSRNFLNSVKRHEFDSVLLMEEIGGKRARWVGTFSKTALMSSISDQLIVYAPKRLDHIRFFQNGKEISVKHVENLERWTNELQSTKGDETVDIIGNNFIDGSNIKNSRNEPDTGQSTLLSFLLASNLPLYVVGFLYDESLKSEHSITNYSFLQRSGTSPKIRSQASVNMPKPQLSFSAGMSFDGGINKSSTDKHQGGLANSISLDYQNKVVGDLTYIQFAHAERPFFHLVQHSLHPICHVLNTKIALAFKNGYDLSDFSSGTSGTYRLKNQTTSIVVFKPIDEEPFAPMNRRSHAGPIYSKGFREGVLSAEGAVREAAAYYVDQYLFHGGLVGVPPTFLAEAVSKSLNYGQLRRYKKLGSAQMFIPGTQTIETYSINLLSIYEVQLIAVFDLLVLNLDRNEGNILIIPTTDMEDVLKQCGRIYRRTTSKWRIFDNTVVNKSSQSQFPNLQQRLTPEGKISNYYSIPIDHGLAFPDSFVIEELDIVWMKSEHANFPTCQPILHLLKSIDLNDFLFHFTKQFSLRPECILVMRVMNIFTKLCLVDYRLSLRETAQLLTDSRRENNNTYSLLESIVRKAYLRASWQYILHNYPISKFSNILNFVNSNLGTQASMPFIESLACELFLDTTDFFKLQLEKIAKDNESHGLIKNNNKMQGINATNGENPQVFSNLGTYTDDNRCSDRATLNTTADNNQQIPIAAAVRSFPVVPSSWEIFRESKHVAKKFHLWNLAFNPNFTSETARIDDILKGISGSTQFQVEGDGIKLVQVDKIFRHKQDMSTTTLRSAAILNMCMDKGSNNQLKGILRGYRLKSNNSPLISYGSLGRLDGVAGFRGALPKEDRNLNLVRYLQHVASSKFYADLANEAHFDIHANDVEFGQFAEDCKEAVFRTEMIRLYLGLSDINATEENKRRGNYEHESDEELEELPRSWRYSKPSSRAGITISNLTGLVMVDGPNQITEIYKKTCLLNMKYNEFCERSAVDGMRNYFFRSQLRDDPIRNDHKEEDPLLSEVNNETEKSYNKGLDFLPKSASVNLKLNISTSIGGSINSKVSGGLATTHSEFGLNAGVDLEKTGPLWQVYNLNGLSVTQECLKYVDNHIEEFEVIVRETLQSAIAKRIESLKNESYQRYITNSSERNNNAARKDSFMKRTAKDAFDRLVKKDAALIKLQVADDIFFCREAISFSDSTEGPSPINNSRSCSDTEEQQGHFLKNLHSALNRPSYQHEGYYLPKVHQLPWTPSEFTLRRTLWGKNEVLDDDTISGSPGTDDAKKIRRTNSNNSAASVSSSLDETSDLFIDGESSDFGDYYSSYDLISSYSDSDSYLRNSSDEETDDNVKIMRQELVEELLNNQSNQESTKINSEEKGNFEDTQAYKGKFHMFQAPRREKSVKGYRSSFNLRFLTENSTSSSTLDTRGLFKRRHRRARTSAGSNFNLDTRTIEMNRHKSSPEIGSKGIAKDSIIIDEIDDEEDMELMFTRRAGKSALKKLSPTGDDNKTNENDYLKTPSTISLSRTKSIRDMQHNSERKTVGFSLRRTVSRTKSMIAATGDNDDSNVNHIDNNIEHDDEELSMFTRRKGKSAFQKKQNQTEGQEVRVRKKPLRRNRFFKKMPTFKRALRSKPAEDLILNSNYRELEINTSHLEVERNDLTSTDIDMNNNNNSQHNMSIQKNGLVVSEVFLNISSQMCDRRFISCLDEEFDNDLLVC